MFSFVFRANALGFLKYYCTFVTLSSNNGALAHLARAFDWQSKGGRFESCMLHFSFPTPWELSLIIYKQTLLPYSSTHYYVQHFNHRRR